MKSFKRHILGMIALSLFLIILPVCINAQGWGYGPVMVYDRSDGAGNASSFNVGVYRNDRGEFGSLQNDSAYSVTVAPGFTVRFCENEGRNGEGAGKCEDLGEGNHNLRYPGKASYIRVQRIGGGWGGNGSNNGGGWIGGGQQGVIVYDDRDYRGRSQAFPVGRFLNGAGQFGNLRNDEASSIIVNRGYRVRLCENEGTMGVGSGNCEEYGEGRYNLRYNDSASYIEVQ